MAVLISRDSEGSAREIRLGQRTVLGRDRHAHVRVAERAVSRRHARIDRGSRGYLLEDLGSANGTFLNDRKLNAPAVLRDGDVIRLGDTSFEFVESQTPSPAERSTNPVLHRRPSTEESTSAPASAEAEDLPRRVGRFELLRLLGVGGMGKIYLAEDTESHRRVAVKFIRTQIGQRDSFLELFHNREAALARQIEHPNVIRILEHGVTDDTHYISMEYAPGLDLGRAMKRRRIELPEAIEILRQVGCGLAAAHRQGVVHSDIKPSNILLLPAGRTPVDSGGDSQVSGRGENTANANAILVFDDEAGQPRTSAAGASRPPRYDAALLDEIRRRSRTPPEELLRDPPFFDRPSELRFLQQYLRRLREGEGHFVLVEGEAGLGKDRLLDEFLRRVTVSGEYGRPPDDLLIGELDASSEEGIAGLYRQLLAKRPEKNANLAETARALVRFVEDLERPAIVRVRALEDPQPAVTHLLSVWGEKIEAVPLLCLAAIAPDDMERNRSLRALIHELRPVTKELYLRPLTEYQVTRYVQQLFGEPPVGGNLVGDVYRLSRGYLSRILSVLRGFVDKGLLSRDEDSTRLVYRPKARDVELEEGKALVEAFRQRSRVEREALELAAFIGPNFFFDTLEKLSRIDETVLFFVLKNLISERFLIEEGRTWYRFTNEAFRRYLAERFPESKRPGLHRKVARIVRSAPVAGFAELSLLEAHHHRGARNPVRAVECLLEAAHHAQNSYRTELVQEAYHEILAIYREARTDDSGRRQIGETLRSWFRRDGNWYEILGKLASTEKRPRVKIADFGISFRLLTEDSTNEVGPDAVMGTPRYMAPERVRGEQGGPRSDIFSLGIVFYEMLVGRPPFTGLKKDELLRANLRRAIRLPAEVAEALPRGVVDLLEGMVAQDASRRLDTEHLLRTIDKLQFELASDRG